MLQILRIDRLGIILGRMIFMFVAIASVPATGQRLHATVNAPSEGIPTDFHFVAVGDSIFFSYYLAPMMNFGSVWILPEGTVKQTQLPQLRNKLLCGITSHDLHVKTFYFFDQEKKSIFIKGFKANLISGTVELLPNQLELKGIFIGSHTDGEILTIYSFEKKKYQLKVTELNRFSVVGEKTYDISFDPGKYKPSEMAVIREGSAVGVRQALAKVKIFVRKDDTYIVLDDTEPYTDASAIEATRRIHGTTLIRLKASGVSDNKFFQESTDRDFRSFLCDEYLFIGSYGQVKTIKLSDGKLVTTVEPALEKSRDEMLAYLRKGTGSNIWIKKLNAYRGTSGLPYLIVSKDSLLNRYVLTMGIYEAQGYPIVPVFSPAGVAASIFASVAASGIQELTDPINKVVYFYMTGDPEHGFDFSRNENDAILRKKIDHFELQRQADGFKARRKGYVQFMDGIMAVYHDMKSGKIEFIHFSR